MEEPPILHAECRLEDGVGLLLFLQGLHDLVEWQSLLCQQLLILFYLAHEVAKGELFIFRFVADRQHIDKVTDYLSKLLLFPICVGETNRKFRLSTVFTQKQHIGSEQECERGTSLLSANLLYCLPQCYGNWQAQSGSLIVGPVE